MTRGEVQRQATPHRVSYHVGRPGAGLSDRFQGGLERELGGLDSTGVPPMARKIDEDGGVAGTPKPVDYTSPGGGRAREAVEENGPAQLRPSGGAERPQILW